MVVQIQIFQCACGLALSQHLLCGVRQGEAKHKKSLFPPLTNGSVKYLKMCLLVFGYGLQSLPTLSIKLSLTKPKTSDARHDCEREDKMPNLKHSLREGGAEVGPHAAGLSLVPS